MGLTLQYILVGLIGIAAVALLCRHFGLFSRRKSAGCPGCNHCDTSAKKAEDIAAVAAKSMPPHS